MSVDWNGPEVKKLFGDLIEKNMKKATLWLKGEVQRSINRGNADGLSPSAPGEPPKKVSTRLFQSIATQVERDDRAIVGRIGTNVEYARRLELGFTGTDSAGRTVDQAERPFLRPALRNNRDALNRLVARGGG